MNDNLRFPSGASVEQAKKDAKSLARERNISLSEAQDQTASQNGLKMRWSKAMNWLNSRPKPLASFKLPLREGYSHVVDISPEATAVLVLGVTGTGKSVLSQLIADQHLGRQAGVELHVFSIVPRPSMTAEYPEFAAAEKQGRDIIRRYPGRVFHHDFDIAADLPGKDAPAGSIILIDEFAAHREMPDRLPEWIRIARERGHILIVCSQVTADIYRDKVPDGIGLLLMSRLQYTGGGTTDTQLLAGLLAQLKFERNVYSEFVAVSIVSGWSGIVRAPFPRLSAGSPTTA